MNDESVSSHVVTSFPSACPSLAANEMSLSPHCRRPIVCCPRRWLAIVPLLFLLLSPLISATPIPTDSSETDFDLDEGTSPFDPAADPGLPPQSAAIWSRVVTANAGVGIYRIPFGPQNPMQANQQYTLSVNTVYPLLQIHTLAADGEYLDSVAEDDDYQPGGSWISDVESQGQLKISTMNGAEIPWAFEVFTDQDPANIGEEENSVWFDLFLDVLPPPPPAAPPPPAPPPIAGGGGPAAA